MLEITVSSFCTCKESHRRT